MERVVNTPAKLLFISAVLLASCGQKTSTPVRIAVQTPSTNNYATHFASWLGFYKEEGLDVTISQIAGASKVLEALVAGSADVGGGVYEQTIQMAAEGKSVVAFLSLTKSPNFAIVAKPGGAVTSIAAMKGHSVGVSSLGSPSQFYLNELLSKAGLSPNDVSTTGVGMGATAAVALEKGQVDAAVLFGSAVTALEARIPNLLILADTRTPEGVRAAFGADEYPGSSLLATKEWLATHADESARVRKAVLRATTWLREHSPEEILAKVPAEFHVGDEAAELAAIRLAKPMYSADGRISKEGTETVRRVLAASLESVRKSNIELANTFVNP